MSSLAGRVREPHSPYIYCLNCFYNLHGLAEQRCPECGRRFDPENSATFSRTPNPEHLPKLVQRVALAINETVGKMTPTDPAAKTALLALRRISRLEQENAMLRTRLELLMAALVESSALSTEQTDAITAAGGLSLDDEIANVSDEPPADEIDSSEELAELHAVVAEQTISDDSAAHAHDTRPKS